MCYDLKTKLESQLKRARRFGLEELAIEIEKELEPYSEIYHATGFTHPKLAIYTNKEPKVPVPSTWGLVPFWVKDNKQRLQLWNRTLNARGETIFDKPSYRDSAKNKRCILFLDGFYEHHHFSGKTYPFLIQRKDGEPMCVAGLWSEWLDKETGEYLNTFSIVTTRGNRLLTKIHNNPKLEGPRMPLILPDPIVEKWLMNVENDLDKEELKQLILPFPDNELKAHPVRKLRGKDAVGNNPNAPIKFEYEELDF